MVAATDTRMSYVLSLANYKGETFCSDEVLLDGMLFHARLIMAVWTPLDDGLWSSWYFLPYNPIPNLFKVIISYSLSFTIPPTLISFTIPPTLIYLSNIYLLLNSLLYFIYVLSNNKTTVCILFILLKRTHCPCFMFICNNKTILHFTHFT